MEEKNTPTQGSEVKDPIVEGLKEIQDKVSKKAEEPADKPETKPEAKPEPAKGPTIGEVLKSEEKKESPRTVPEAPFLELKTQNKELKKELKELKELIEAGGSRQEVSASLLEIAEEHNVDVNFLKRLAQTIKSEAKAEVEAEYTAKMKPLEDKERYDRIDTIFNYHYEKTLEAMPEYKGIVNKDVIKSLSLLKENANKTFPQLLEESYGHLISGKKTLDSGSPTRQGGDEITEVDFFRAQNDSEYREKVMANPELKRKYNAKMLKELKI